jgi:transcriptional regulator with XRE-family HTH domain
MKERLLEFLRAENKTSAQLAEEIGVQPSGISHIISGRNNPSLDFVLKMLEKYPYLSTEWLLFGKGIMYKDSRMQTLFDESQNLSTDNYLSPDSSDASSPDKKMNNIELIPAGEIKSGHKQVPGTSLSRIVWFYEDSSFEEYFPRK